MKHTPDWTRHFVTAITETETGETVVKYTAWRAVLDPTYARRHQTCDEIDLTVFADDATHGPGLCDTDCHKPGDRTTFMVGMSVPDGLEREQVDAARTALAEQGFRIDGPWVPGPNGTLTAPLVPVILDPTCAAFEPESAGLVSGDPQEQDAWTDLPVGVAMRWKAAWLNARGADVCPDCLCFRAHGTCRQERAHELARASVGSS